MIASHPFPNNFNSLEKEIRFFNGVSAVLKSFSSKLLNLVISVVLVVILITLSPFIYLVLVSQLRTTTRNLALIRAELPRLSISELTEIREKFNGILKNQSSFSALKTGPTILKPFLLVISHAAEQCLETVTLIDKQIEEDMQLFEKALETDTPIGF